MNLYYKEQLEIIKQMHAYVEFIPDNFFRFLNLLDSTGYYILVTIFVYCFFHKKIGEKLFFIILISSYVNTFLKNIFALPRPMHLDPSLALISFKDYGFPSGAAQSTILFSFIVMKLSKSAKAFFCCAIYIFLISLSRIYLGAHFFTDIFGGWIVGLIIGYAFFSSKLLSKCFCDFYCKWFFYLIGAIFLFNHIFFCVYIVGVFSIELENLLMMEKELPKKEKWLQFYIIIIVLILQSFFLSYKEILWLNRLTFSLTPFFIFLFPRILMSLKKSVS